VKSLLRATILLAVFSLLPPGSEAQLSEGIKLHGRVILSPTMQPVEGVLVELVRRGMTQDRTYTDSRGEFEFVRLVMDEYVLRVRREGYLAIERTVNMKVEVGGRGSVFNVHLTLERDPDSAAADPPAMQPLSARELQVPEGARSEFQAGFRELNHNNQPEKSIPLFEKAIALHKDFDEAYVQLALAHFLMGKRSSALRTLARAVEVYPQNARAFALMGKVLIDAKQPEPGMQALEEALAIDETLWSAHADLATTLLQGKELDRALLHARRAHALNERVPTTHILLASVLLEMKSYGDAVKEMDEFLRLFPDHAGACAVRKQRDEARKQSKQQP
jgi:Tfp pilus assembly protein PilF